MQSKLIELKNITKKYDKNTIIDNMNLYVNKNEFMTFLGPSGCGKTTTLRMIAGFEVPTAGDVCFNGKRINDIPPYQRQINTVFQRYALFPHLDVFENIAFGLRIQKMSQKKIDEKVNKMLDLFNLSDYGTRHIDSLSGGQQQRIAIARALVNEPEVLLLDEPLGALDLKLRKEMQVELKTMQKKLGITFVYVTHDQEEALTMSDTIVVMNDGEIQQIGSPIDIYNEPINAFVADFIGESNIISGIMKKDYLVEFFGKQFECVDKGFGTDEEVEIVIRPEDLDLIEVEKAKLIGKVKSIIFKGVHYEMMIEMHGYEMMVQSTDKAEVGDIVGLTLVPDDIHIMKKGDN